MPSVPRYAGTAEPIGFQPLPCRTHVWGVAVVFDSADVVTVITCVALPVE